jgi:uncharacterized protein with PQ loop repeat
MLEIIGLIGATTFALSGVPQAVKSVREGHSAGMSHGTIVLWLLGEGAMLVYAGIKYTTDYILICNYLANFLVVGVIAWYKYLPRTTQCQNNVGGGSTSSEVKSTEDSTQGCQPILTVGLENTTGGSVELKQLAEDAPGVWYTWNSREISQQR